MPDQWRSFQKRFDGCAYAWPVVPVRTPGFTPTRRRVRFGGMVSRRRDFGVDCRWRCCCCCRWVVAREVVEGVVTRDGGGDCNEDAERERVIRPVSVGVAMAVTVASLVFLRFGLAPGLSSSLSTPRDVESRFMSVAEESETASGVEIFALFPE